MGNSSYGASTITGGDGSQWPTGGEVILPGAVRSWAERYAAERATWSAPGVSKVDNRISINRNDHAKKLLMLMALMVVGGAMGD
jgi:hypothetical protein